MFGIFVGCVCVWLYVWFVCELCVVCCLFWGACACGVCVTVCGLYV